MEITEVRVKLVHGKSDKLRAFCSITIDNDFVIRDLKVIDGVKGPFVAMPSRKLMEKCPSCSGKNHFRARYCNDCGKPVSRSGSRRPEPEYLDEGGGRSRLHTEIAHPINSRCREELQKTVLERYEEEQRAHDSGSYVEPEAEDSALEKKDHEKQDREEPVESGSTAIAPGAEPAPPAGFDEPGLAWGEREAETASEFGGRAGSRVLNRPPSTSSEPSRPGASRGEEAREGAGGPSSRGEKSRDARDPVQEPDKRSRYFDDASLGDDSEPEDNFGAGLL